VFAWAKCTAAAPPADVARNNCCKSKDIQVFAPIVANLRGQHACLDEQSLRNTNLDDTFESGLCGRKVGFGSPTQTLV
jgi:hypothetical protein